MREESLLASIAERLQPLLREPEDALPASEMILRQKAPRNPLLYAAVVEADLRERFTASREKRDRDKRTKLVEFEKLPEGIHPALSSLFRVKAMLSTDTGGGSKVLLSRLLQVLKWGSLLVGWMHVTSVIYINYTELHVAQLNSPHCHTQIRFIQA